MAPIARLGFAGRPTTFVGIDGTFGRNAYNHLDRTAFKLQETPKNSWEIAAYYGKIDANLNWSLRARAVYGQSYEVADEVQICRTVTGSTDQDCIKGPDGLPTRKRSGLASVEGRYRFAITEQQIIAFAPQVTYNFETRDVGVEVPIYLSQDANGKLSGGLKLAYTSKKDDFGIGVFVGVPFSVFF